MAKGDPDSPVLKYVDSLVDSLRKLIPSAVTGENDKAVHDARVATRRLKAASDLVKPVVSRRCRGSFNRVGRLLRRQLGPLRDLDVMLEHLGEFKQPRLQPAIQWLRQRLGEARQEAVRCAGQNAPPARMLARLGTWWGLRHEIETAHDQIGQLLTQSVHIQLDAFVEQAEELAGAGRSDPHPLRIAGKSLRYTLEMAREHGCRLPSSVVSLFKRMQTALGLWHDYVVLAERIMRESVDCDLALHDPQLQTELLGVVQLCLRRSESRLKRMAGLWKTHGQSLTQTIRQAFLLTQHVQSPAQPPVAEPIPTIAESSASISIAGG
jgi:CHAD domain-containing protein